LLTSSLRPYLGLLPIDEQWDEIDLEGARAYFDGDRLVKVITPETADGRSRGYFEYDVSLPTTERRSVPPHRQGGKSSPLTLARATAHGVRTGFAFHWDQKRSFVAIMRDATDWSVFPEDDPRFKDRDGVLAWLEDFVRHAPEDWLTQIEAQRVRVPKRVRWRGGDVFLIQARDVYGFAKREYRVGRVLLDLGLLSKRSVWGGRAWDLAVDFWGNMIAQLYPITMTSSEVDLGRLRALSPSVPVAAYERRLTTGELPIVGSIPVEPREVDFPEFLSQGRFIKGGIAVEVPGALTSEMTGRFAPGFTSLGRGDGPIPDNDLRSSPELRAPVLAAIGLESTMSYDAMCAALEQGPTAAELIAVK